ncbi:MAG: LCP family protein [Hyphomonadaceae bacterium]|nr:LCP family protein [Clostridia bacterium]
MQRRKMHKIGLIVSVMAVVVFVVVAIDFFGMGNFSKNSQLGKVENAQIIHAEEKINADGTLNCLVMGVDQDKTRTDVLMWVQFDRKNNRVNVLQIPRDTYSNTKRADKKVNSAYGYGKEERVFAEVQKLIGVKVDKYIMVNFKGFKDLVDAVGGVSVNVPINMKYDDPEQNLHINLKKGEQILNGAKAEMFVRYRKDNSGEGYAEGDLGRVNAQQQFLKNLTQALASQNSILRLPQLVSIVMSNVSTNLSASEILGNMQQGSKIGQENMHFYTLPGQPKYFSNGWYYIVNDAETKALIESSFTPENAVAKASAKPSSNPK